MTDAPGGSASPTTFLAPSPLRGSPLSNPPIFAPTRTPSPSHANGRPIPKPTRRRASQPISPRPLIAPSPLGPLTACSSSAALSAALSTSPSPPQTISPLSRSQPLLGSYQLSLLHSRMSLAHPPRSLPLSSSAGFTLRIGAVGKGRSCPPELRCPPPLEVPLQATYYELEDPNNFSTGRTRGAAQSPWTGNVDLEAHHFAKYARDASWAGHASQLPQGSRQPSPPSPPPMYPGYQVAPYGQLQLIIRTPVTAVKAFILTYDARHLSVGGKLLIRERTFVQPTAATPGSELDAPTAGSLRYAIQLQITCCEQQGVRSGPRFRNSSTRRTRRVVSSPSPVASRQSPTTHSIEERSFETARPAGRAFFVSKQIKLIFDSCAPDKSEQVRTERTDELVQPSGLPPPDMAENSRGRAVGSSPGSLARSQEWETVRLKWIARKEVEQEMGRGRAMADRDDTAGDDVVEQVQEEERNVEPGPTLSFARQPIPSLEASSTSPSKQMSLLPSRSPVSLLSPLPTIESREASRAVSPSGVGTGSRGISPHHGSSLKTPNVQRYARNPRRGSGSHEERELSEKLRAMAVEET